MTFKTVLFDVGKLLICGLAFFAGLMLGGMISTMLGFSLPKPPEGADMSVVQTFSILTTPLLALGLALLARGLSGSFVVRALVLSFLMWIAYGVNTQLEATIVSTYAAGFWYAVTMYAFAALFCGAAVAWLFPAEKGGGSAAEAIKAHFTRRSAPAWMWRLAAAAVVFMPIYYFFGLLVLPFTGDYYRQAMFGLVMPTLETLLPILVLRSVLFLLACLPVILLWQKSDRSLFWRLGAALFVLVGFVIMLYAMWLPLYVRVPHTLEILADEFVYAGALVWLLGKRGTETQRTQQMTQQRTI